MMRSAIENVLPYTDFAREYIEKKFGFSKEEAEDVVTDVLARYLRIPMGDLHNPKRHFIRACRWHVFQVCVKQRQHHKKTHTPPDNLPEDGQPVVYEPLVVLEEEDREKFFKAAPPPPREAMELLLDGQTPQGIALICNIGDSTVRIRLQGKVA